jgi:hypothetical protein
MSEQTNRIKVRRWHAAGFPALLLLGSVLHFVFAWSGRSPWVGLLGAVNESIWEHLKLGFWALILYSAVEYAFIRRAARNTFLGKLAGILCLEGFIVVFFYTYTALLGRTLLFLDIGSFVVGAALCQLVSFRILTSTRARPRINGAALGLLAAHAACVMIFTFRPPELPLFRDFVTGGYGIEAAGEPLPGRSRAH